MGTPKCQLWENFNKNSKAIAKAKGMDTIVLAEKSGMSRQSIYSYWSGRLMPGLKRIEKIAAVLGVDPITLFEDPKSIDVKDIVAGGDGHPKPAPVPPEELLNKDDRAALAVGRELMALQDYELLLSVCRHVPPERIKHIAALLIG